MKFNEIKFKIKNNILKLKKEIFIVNGSGNGSKITNILDISKNVDLLH